jgi:Alcohol dehydrogenase transcription factor Myb/SANT-like.
MTTLADNTNTSSVNNGVMDAKLVREVEKHPALYNPKRRGYKDTAEMDRSWMQIANELGMKRKSPFLLPKYSSITLWQHKTEG